MDFFSFFTILKEIHFKNKFSVGKVLQSQRENMEAVWEQDIWPRVKKTCEDLNLPVVIPRRCGEMIYKNNTPEILQTYSSEEQLEFHS